MAALVGVTLTGRRPDVRMGEHIQGIELAADNPFCPVRANCHRAVRHFPVCGGAAAKEAGGMGAIARNSSSLRSMTADFPIAIRVLSASTKGKAVTGGQRCGRADRHAQSLRLRLSLHDRQRQEPKPTPSLRRRRHHQLAAQALWIRHETSSTASRRWSVLPRIEFESAAFTESFTSPRPIVAGLFDVLPQSTMEFLLESPKFVLEFQLLPDTRLPREPASAR